MNDQHQAPHQHAGLVQALNRHSDDVTVRLDRLEACLDRIERRLLVPTHHKDAYTTVEASLITGWASWTLRRKCSLGHIQAQKKDDGEWLIPQSELDRLGRKVAPQPKAA